MSPRSTRIAATTAFALASLAVLALVGLCARERLRYPFELSKMEGAFVDHARVAARGEAIFRPPSAEFIPHLYTPLSHHAAGWLIRAGLDGFAAARAVSVAGLLGGLAIGVWLARRAGARGILLLGVPVAFAAHYFDVHAFYDQARPDNLLALFWMGAVAALCLPSGRVAVPLFALCGVLAFFTKQSSAVLLALLLAGYLVVDWRRAVACGALLLAATAGTFAGLDRASDGWLSAYTLSAPSHHGLDHRQLFDSVGAYFFGEFADLTGPAVLAAAALLFARARPGPGDVDRTRFALLAAAISAAGFSAASIWQPIAIVNVFVLFALTGAAFLPVALAWGIEALPEERRPLGRTLALVALALVALHGVRDPRPWIPTAENRATWQELREGLASYGPPERSWVMLHGAAWGSEPGAPMTAHFPALLDFVGGYFGGKTGYDPPADLVAKVEQRWFDVILVAEWDWNAKAFVERTYEPDESRPGLRLPAFTGYGEAFERYWIPKKRAEVSPGGR